MKVISNRIQFYGAKWCGDCRRSKQLLDDHNISYDYIDLEVNPKAVEFVKKINNGYQSIPTIILPNGKILVEPSNIDLKNHLGIRD